MVYGDCNTSQQHKLSRWGTVCCKRANYCMILFFLSLYSSTPLPTPPLSCLSSLLPSTCCSLLPKKPKMPDCSLRVGKWNYQGLDGKSEMRTVLVKSIDMPQEREVRESSILASRLRITLLSAIYFLRNETAWMVVFLLAFFVVSCPFSFRFSVVLCAQYFLCHPSLPLPPPSLSPSLPLPPPPSLSPPLPPSLFLSLSTPPPSVPPLGASPEQCVREQCSHSEEQFHSFFRSYHQ